MLNGIKNKAKIKLNKKFSIKHSIFTCYQNDDTKKRLRKQNLRITTKKKRENWESSQQEQLC